MTCKPSKAQRPVRPLWLPLSPPLLTLCVPPPLPPWPSSRPLSLRQLPTQGLCFCCSLTRRRLFHRWLQGLLPSSGRPLQTAHQKVFPGLLYGEMFLPSPFCHSTAVLFFFIVYITSCGTVCSFVLCVIPHESVSCRRTRISQHKNSLTHGLPVNIYWENE